MKKILFHSKVKYATSQSMVSDHLPHPKMVNDQLQINSIFLSKYSKVHSKVYFVKAYSKHNYCPQVAYSSTRLTFLTKKGRIKELYAVMLNYVLFKSAQNCCGMNHLIVSLQIWNLNLGKFKYFNKYSIASK